MTIRERETGFSPVGILGMRLPRIDWGGLFRHRKGHLLLETDGGEREQVREQDGLRMYLWTLGSEKCVRRRSLCAHIWTLDWSVVAPTIHVSDNC